MKRYVICTFLLGLSSVLFGQNTYNISTVAGTVATANGDSVNAGQAPLFNPQGVVVDASGNIYIADGDAHRVRKIDGTTGVITTIAGQGRSASSGDASVQATAGPLNDPTGLALSPDGTILYIAERDASKIKALNVSTGALTTIVGFGGRSGFAGDNSPALNARIRNPYALATDKAGNLYIADRGNNRIRKVCIATKVKSTDCTTGNITTVAGIGPTNADPGFLIQYFGDGGLATRAQLARAEGIAVDASGNLFIADTNNNAIRKVDATTGIITTVAGSCVSGAPIATVGSAPPTGNTQLPLGTPFPTCGATTGRTAASPVALTTANQKNLITFIDGGPAVNATLNAPRGLAFDSVGNLYIADTGTNRVRIMDVNGNIRTLAGSGTSAGATGDGGLANVATLSAPRGVAVDASGNVYITDQTQGQISNASASGRLRVVDGPSQLIRTVNSKLYSGDGGSSLNASFNDARGLAVDTAGNIIVADTNNQRIRKLTKNSDGTYTASSIMGNLGAGFSGDTGPASVGRVNNPNCVAVDSNNNIYIADRSNNRVRKIDGSGNITTVAGGGTSDATDGILAINAVLNGPRCVAVDAAGNLYVADTGNNAVRKVDTNGIITTVAGTFIPNPLLPFSPGATKNIGVSGTPIIVSGPSGPTMQTPNSQGTGDGGPAIFAFLNGPQGVALDAAGANLYIADTGNHVVRVVNLGSGIISMVAGGYTDGGADGLPTGAQAPAGSIGAAELTRLNSPLSVAVDAGGAVYIADTLNYRVVKVDTAGFAYVIAGGGTTQGDNKAATAVALTMPKAVAVDSATAANVFVIEGLGLIRQLTPAK